MTDNVEAIGIKPAPTPEQIARRKAVKVVGYQGWLGEWRRANPEAGVEERKAAWNEAKKERMRDARRVVAKLEKNGLMVVPAPETLAAE